MEFNLVTMKLKEKLERYKINYKYFKDIENVVSEYILENKTVGWFQGKAEFGQRALGNRSILANQQLKILKISLIQLSNIEKVIGPLRHHV